MSMRKTLDQSEASIQVMWSLSTNERDSGVSEHEARAGPGAWPLTGLWRLWPTQDIVGDEATR